MLQIFLGEKLGVWGGGKAARQMKAVNNGVNAILEAEYFCIITMGKRRCFDKLSMTNEECHPEPA
jgi:hypothetical protein